MSERVQEFSLPQTVSQGLSPGGERGSGSWQPEGAFAHRHLVFLFVFVCFVLFYFSQRDFARGKLQCLIPRPGHRGAKQERASSGVPAPHEVPSPGHAALHRRCSPQELVSRSLVTTSGDNTWTLLLHDTPPTRVGKNGESRLPPYSG